MAKVLLIVFCVSLQGCTALLEAVTATAGVGSAYFGYLVSEKPPTVIYSAECAWGKEILPSTEEEALGLSEGLLIQIEGHNQKLEQLCP